MRSSLLTPKRRLRATLTRVAVTATDGEAYEGSVSFPWNVAAPPVTAATVPPRLHLQRPGRRGVPAQRGEFHRQYQQPIGRRRAERHHQRGERLDQQSLQHRRRPDSGHVLRGQHGLAADLQPDPAGVPVLGERLRPRLQRRGLEQRQLVDGGGQLLRQRKPGNRHLPQPDRPVRGGGAQRAHPHRLVVNRVLRRTPAGRASPTT